MFGGATKFVVAAIGGILVILQQFVVFFHGDAGHIFSAVVSGVTALLVYITGPGGPGTVTRIATGGKRNTNN